MAVSRKFSPNRWSRDTAYRADYFVDLVEGIAEEVQTLGWSVAPTPAWDGDLTRPAEGRLEQFENEDQIRISVDAKAKTIHVSHHDASADEESWAFDLPLSTPVAEIAAAIQSR
jgi:hypothetical protein